MPTMLPVSFAAWLSSAGTFAAPVGDVVPAPNLGGSQPPGGPVLPTSAMPMVVFLDFEGPQIVYGDVDDSHTNTSFIQAAAVDYTPYGDATARAALMQAVQLDWSPYAVTLTETRPDAGDYVLAVVSPTNPYAGQAAGIAPLDCNDSWTRNNVVFAFHGANDGYSINEQARTIGQEVAHSLGLEHTTNPNDIMSYSYGPADFWFVDECMDILTTQQAPVIWCTAQHEEFCPAEQQNSHAELIELVGDAIPDTTDPEVSIVAPLDGDAFEAGASFDILVEASDDVGVAEVELFANGESVAVDGAPPWSWSANSIGVGRYELHAEARDLAGNVASSETVTIDVDPQGSDGEDDDQGAPADDDGVEPADDDEGEDDDAQGSEDDAGTPPSDDPDADPSDDEGGTSPSYVREDTLKVTCTVAPTPPSALLSLLVLVALRRRK
jgi:hypothetical protein